MWAYRRDDFSARYLTDVTLKHLLVKVEVIMSPGIAMDRLNPKDLNLYLFGIFLCADLLENSEDRSPWESIEDKLEEIR